MKINLCSPPRLDLVSAFLIEALSFCLPTRRKKGNSEPCNKKSFPPNENVFAEPGVDSDRTIMRPSHATIPLSNRGANREKAEQRERKLIWFSEEAKRKRIVNM